MRITCSKAPIARTNTVACSGLAGVPALASGNLLFSGYSLSACIRHWLAADTQLLVVPHKTKVLLVELHGRRSLLDIGLRHGHFDVPAIRLSIACVLLGLRPTVVPNPAMERRESRGRLQGLVRLLGLGLIAGTTCSLHGCLGGVTLLGSS